jgi:hypothetical protein
MRIFGFAEDTSAQPSKLKRVLFAFVLAYAYLCRRKPFTFPVLMEGIQISKQAYF